MEISPIPTLSKEINNIREATASIVADQIIPNELKEQMNEVILTNKLLGED